MKKGVRILLIVLMLLISGAAYLYFRIRAGVDSAVNVQKLEDGFYYMEYRDDYGFDRFLEQGGAASDLDVAKFVGKALFKGFLYPRFLGGSFGCSTLSARNPKGGVMYGRNFDWMECTSMVVKSKPERGYASVSTVNLDFLNLGTEYDPEKTVSKIISAAALYAPMDGINEEGLCVAVLMIDDSAVTEQDTGKPDLTTTTAVRLLLDKAASVDEAVQLLGQYDMHSSADMMLHLALSDKSGRSVAVEYVNNEMSVVETPVVTNFYLTQGDKYGIGTEQSHTRYEMLLERLSEQPAMDMENIKDAMSSVSKNNFGEFASAGVVGILSIQRVLTQGAFAGFLTGIGSSAADIFYACVGVFGLTFISDILLKHQSTICMVGCLMVVAIGVRTIKKKESHSFASAAGNNKEEHPGHIFSCFLSSFVIAITNPATILSFMVVFSMFRIGGNESVGENVQLICGIFAGTCIWWLAIAVIVSLYRKKVTDDVYFILNRIFGALMILFGIVIGVRGCLNG